jgi:hypothetical protein
VAMLSSVIRSPRAVAANIEIMRAFVSMRRYARSHEELARRVDELERDYRLRTVRRRSGRQRVGVGAPRHSKVSRWRRMISRIASLVPAPAHRPQTVRRDCGAPCATACGTCPGVSGRLRSPVAAGRSAAS